MVNLADLEMLALTPGVVTTPPPKYDHPLKSARLRLSDADNGDGGASQRAAFEARPDR